MPGDIPNDYPVLFNLNGVGVIAPQSEALRMQHRAAHQQHRESLALLADSFTAGVSYLTARALNARPATQEAAIRFGANVGQFGVSLGGNALPKPLRGSQPSASKAERAPHSERPYKPTPTRAHAQFEQYKTEAARWMQKPVAREPALAKMVDELFRDGAEIGNGSTSAAVRYERRTAMPVGDKFHETKADNTVRFLDSWLKTHPDHTNDRMTAELLRRDLLDALSTTPTPAYYEALRQYREKNHD